MSESVNELAELGPADFDAWIAGASLAQASTEILQKPSLLSDYEDWKRRWDRAQRTPAERALGQPDPLAVLEAEGESLLAELEASRTVWHVRQIENDELDAIAAAFPEPEKPEIFEELPPKALQSGATDAQSKAYLRSFDAWTVRRDAFNVTHSAEHEAWARAANEMLADRGAEKIARATVRIEQAGRVIATSITNAQARALGEKIGAQQVAKILDLIDQVGAVAPEVPADFLSES